MKRKALKSATVCGLTFQAETVAEAKRKGELEVTALAREANLGPSVYRVHNLHVLVWRTLESWNYRVMDPAMRDGVVHANCTYNAFDRTEAVAHAVYAAAQYQWQTTIPAEEDAGWVRAAFNTIDHTRAGEAKMNDLLHWVGWQRRYAAAYAMCGDRNVAHDNATRTRTVDEVKELTAREIGARMDAVV